jgi:hypothetical protein
MDIRAKNGFGSRTATFARKAANKRKELQVRCPVCNAEPGKKCWMAARDYRFCHEQRRRAA